MSLKDDLDHLLKTDKPTVKLAGEDGNAFAIIARCSNALKRAGLKDEAAKFRQKCMNAGDYDGILQLAMEYCEVE